MSLTFTSEVYLGNPGSSLERTGNVSGLIISGITNFLNNRTEAEEFDIVLAEYQKLIHAMPEMLRGGVLKVYINFQYDCMGLPNAVEGIHLDRFSKRNCTLGADIEVKRIAIADLNAVDKRKTLGRLTIETLELMERKFKDKV